MRDWRGYTYCWRRVLDGRRAGSAAIVSAPFVTRREAHVPHCVGSMYCAGQLTSHEPGMAKPGEASHIKRCCPHLVARTRLLNDWGQLIRPMHLAPLSNSAPADREARQMAKSAAHKKPDAYCGYPASRATLGARAHGRDLVCDRSGREFLLVGQIHDVRLPGRTEYRYYQIECISVR